ncbi:hypothetical protein ACJMK2_020899 [Sinanodonta woodiana]|uniref:Uncharacterized protein n=1 Tax=Sinanodonta woodiana TaxID=1069815 RepID=A0ABD3U1M9_SINWO
MASIEDNMNYLHEDSFGSPGGPYLPEHNSLNYQYTGGNINGGEGSIGFDHRASPHSSRMSLQSSGSNRNLPRSQIAKVQNAHGSRSSLPHEGHPSDNYMPYSGQNRNYDDMRGSPLPPAGSPPPGPGEHLRSRNHADDYPTSLARFGVDSYDNQLPLQSSNHVDSSFNHYNDRDVQYADDRYRGPPDDRYGDPSFDEGRYQGDPLPDNSFYRQSPMLDKRGPPLDRYMDPPFDEDPRGPHPDDRFVDPHSDLYRRPPLDDSYQGPPPNDGYHGPPHDDSYRDHQDDRYGPPDDSYQGPPIPNESYHGYQDDGDRYRGYPDDSFHGPPHDRSIENPPNDSFQDPPQVLYSDNHPHEQVDDPYKRSMDDHRHDGLPPVRVDPFADDPFQVDGRAGPQRVEDPYNRGPSPGAGSDRMAGTGIYRDRPQFDPRDSFDPLDNRPPYEQDSHQEYPDEKGRLPYYDDEITRGEAHPIAAGPQDDYHSDGRHTPSTDGRTMKWRRPDLQEIIEYLSHPSDMIKANAAAYLQHLCFNDDDIKAKTRGLDGLPPLVELLNSEFPEVHKNACGALKNLSYGKNNDDNKRAIKNAGGIPALIRLLRKTQDEDVRDSVTGVLWNLSSLEDLKKPIIDDGLAVLVNVVIIPHSGYDKPGMTTFQGHEPFTTIFRNVTGVLRNVSSVGIEARRKLRECHGLVNSLIHTLQSANEQNNIDNKPVENCMCILRNLTYRIQEVEDPEFFKKRNATLQRQKQPSKENTGCFGGGKKKPPAKGKSPDTSQLPPPRLPPQANEYKGLWSANAVQQYLHLLTSSNPVTLEASCGALQNLAACDWQPAVEIRAIVRKEKGLPGLVDLLTYELDRVVCAAATALRNLSLDERNKELVGKYAMKQLVSNLPQDNRQRETNDETVSAVLATLNEVIQHNQDFAKSFCQEDGVTRLMHIARNQSKFTYRTVKYAVAVLKALWKFKVLHSEFTRLGYTDKDFNVTITARPDGTGPSHSNFSTPYNTLSRPMASQGYDDTTMSSNRGLARNGGYSGFGKQDGYSGGGSGMIQGHSNPALAADQDHFIHGSRNRVDEIPMSDIGPGYAPIVERNHRVKPPVGGVPLLPNLPPSQLQPPSNMSPNEPLYAMVQKGNRRRPDDGGPPGYSATQDGGPQGADSWV